LKSDEEQEAQSHTVIAGYSGIHQASLIDPEVAQQCFLFSAANELASFQFSFETS
jgi:hypothetical protein